MIIFNKNKIQFKSKPLKFNKNNKWINKYK